ncbi:hypothetical protein J6590_027089 [Homalodisca vitripennis]|nr:hypothetical protein J6590_027089 [Homalodisca vitripennis]
MIEMISQNHLRTPTRWLDNHQTEATIILSCGGRGRASRCSERRRRESRVPMYVSAPSSPGPVAESRPPALRGPPQWSNTPPSSHVLECEVIYVCEIAKHSLGIMGIEESCVSVGGSFGKTHSSSCNLVIVQLLFPLLLAEPVEFDSERCRVGATGLIITELYINSGQLTIPPNYPTTTGHPEFMGQVLLICLSAADLPARVPS